jgi:hypothetical protein
MIRINLFTNIVTNTEPHIGENKERNIIIPAV